MRHDGYRVEIHELGTAASAARSAGDRLGHVGPGAAVVRRASVARRASAVLTAAGLLLVAACSTDPGGSTTPEDQLRARPGFEQVGSEYLAMLAEMRTALSAIVPVLQWRTAAPAERGRAVCRPPFTDVQGTDAAGYTSGNATGSIPDADWPAAVRTVTEIAGRHGFTTVNALTDRPGNHAVAVLGTWGQSVELGTAEATTLAVFGPCLLHAAAHPSTSSSG